MKKQILISIIIFSAIAVLQANTKACDGTTIHLPEPVETPLLSLQLRGD